MFAVRGEFDRSIGQTAPKKVQHRLEYKTRQLLTVLNKDFFLEHRWEVVSYIVREHMLPLELPVL